jgi:PmbA protein
MDLNRFKYFVNKAARGKGAGQFELYHSRTDSFRVSIYKGEVDAYDVNTSAGVGLRLITNGKMGYSYSEKIDESAAEMLVEAAIANASIIDSDEKEFIYASRDVFSHVDTYNGELSRVTPQQKISLAMDMEKCAFGVDKRVDRIKSCIVGTYDRSVSISNSEGLDLSHKSNGIYAYIIPVAVTGVETKTAVAYRTGRDFGKIDAAELAREAVEEAISYFGAEPVKSGQYSVIFRNDAAADILGVFSGVFIADNVQKGLSLLKGKKGSKIASTAVTIKDAPLLKGGLCSVPFDAEGVATMDKDVVSDGVLTTYLYNLKTAFIDGVKSTGNASRGSYASKVSTSPANFFIAPGPKQLAGIMKDMTDGLYITELQGLHSGANMVSGDFSLAAKGFLVKGGNLDRPVEDITVAGNFFELLQNILETADDLRFGMPSGSACFGSPALLVSGLSIAGN